MRRLFSPAAGIVLLLSLSGMPVSTARADSPATSGERIYQHWCAPCHAPGPGHPGTQSLQLKYAGKVPADLLQRTDLSAQVVATFVRQGVLLMAPFRKTEITDAELNALAAYVASRHKKK